MKRARILNISIGLLLSGSLLAGCGGRNSASEPTLTEPESTVSDTDSAADPANPETDNADTPATETATGGNGTAINPPKPASLKAQQADAQINLRSRPTTAAEAKGYGLVDDPVQLLRAAEGEGGLTWYYVKFDESGAEGWIRGDFIDTSGTTPANRNQGADVSIEAFSFEEIFAVGSGGCGMTLWSVDNPEESIFFNGLPDTSMWMKLDGTMTEFRRTAASGPEFYGQSASQSFVSQDGAIAVDVTASVGSEAGYESVNIQQGKLVLEGPAGGTTEITVAGDAGC